MSAAVTPAATPHNVSALPPALPEQCAWCGRQPPSCLACIECLQLFCSRECHLEFLEEERVQLRRITSQRLVN